MLSKNGQTWKTLPPMFKADSDFASVPLLLSEDDSTIAEPGTVKKYFKNFCVFLQKQQKRQKIHSIFMFI